MTDILSHFTSLDELIQVVYQGFYRFVVICSVDDDHWTVHLGLQDEGRWWRGRWGPKDISAVAGSKASGKLLEAFADKLVETFVGGELYVTDFSVEQGAEIKLTLGSTQKRPLHIALAELTAEEAATQAAKLFFEIAKQAQSRNCRINGSSSFTSTSAPLPPNKKESTGSGASKTTLAAQPKSPSQPSPGTAARTEIRILKAQLAASEKNRRQDSPTPCTQPSKRPPKGASLANPNKKARKYQEIEFESDDD